MKALLVAVALWLASATPVMAEPVNPPEPVASIQSQRLVEEQDLRSIPRGKGLPVIVRVGLYYQELSDLKENEGNFGATVDLRLRWQDLRLRYDGAQTPLGFKEYGGARADEMLASIWTPNPVLDNLQGEPSYRATNLRVFPDGWVEVMQRTRGRFSFEADPTSFPFDRQVLKVEVLVREKTTKEAALVVLQQDLEFSGAAEDIRVGGWDVGLVSLKRSLKQGWYGSFHSGIVAGLTVRRQPGDVITPIFVPLLASLLIPLLAIWMNNTEDGEFGDDAFEFGNILIGGLFAVIALNFSIDSAYGFIATGDNVVTRLLGLNYAALSVSILVLVLIFRLNLPMRLFGRRVQKVLFRYLYWALPTLIAAIAAAFVALILV